jgi:hypothetical protein
MSNGDLPAELLDHIVDLLHDSRNALKSCCLVSKSWIPRARNHLFASVKFTTGEDLQSWKTAFPDPYTSPACYTKTLHLKCPLAVAAEDREKGWISTFNHVVHFKLDSFEAPAGQFSLTPFLGFSPAIKSLHLIFDTVPSSQAFDLIYSFPLLDDLAVTSYDRWIDFDDQMTSVLPLVSPSFAGCLELDLWFQMDFVASRLLSSSGGLHFRRLDFALNEETGASQIMALVEACRFTLQSLEVVSELFGAFICYRCPQQSPIFVCRHIAIRADRPLKCHTT